MYDLPVTVEIEGVDYSIRNGGDYRTIIDIFAILEDPELDEQERAMAALIIFYADMEDVEDLAVFPNLQEALDKMFEFFNAGKKDVASKSRKLLDWQDDMPMIVSAVNNVAKKEIRAEKYLHWWTFMSYYMSVGDSTLSTVVNIRDKIVQGKKLEKWENEFKQENPQYFIWNAKTIEEIEAENWLASVLNKG